MRSEVQSPIKDSVIPDVKKRYQWFPCLALNIKRETAWLFLKKQKANSNNTIFEGLMEDWLLLNIVETKINTSLLVSPFDCFWACVFCVVTGESIPIRLFLSGYELTPTMRDINKKFSVRYYLNLVLVDEEERRYFKQQVRMHSLTCTSKSPHDHINCRVFGEVGGGGGGVV